jgi:WD40 repeat protein
VGPLADVYSLGATLYCLVTGRPPFQAASSIETLKQVVEREPLAPHFLNPAVDRDLDTICLKCLEKQPQKRYASAIALADDLRRFLERRPIHARPVSRLEKGVRWCRRNPVVAGSLSGVVGIFVAAFVLVTWSYLRAERALEEQATQRRHADLAREDAERKRLAERWERYRSTVAAASAALELQNTGTARSALAAAPSELRDWEWRFLESQLDGARQVWNVPGGEVMQISVDRSGRRIAAACKNDRNVYQYDIGVGRGCPTARDGGSPISALVMSPDGTRIAAGYADGSVGIADAATGQRIGIYRGVTPSLLMLYSPDGTRIATYEGSNTRLLDGSTGAEVAALAGMRDRAGLPVDHKIWQRKRVDGLGEALASTDAIAFSADGKRVAAAAAEYVRVCDAMTGELEWSLGPHDAPVRMVIISRDGRLIAASTYGGSDSIYLWEVSTGRQLAVFRGHKAIVLKMDFSPDGRRLASASNYPDNTARIWDAIGGKSLAVMTGHKNWVVHVAFSPDGKRVLTTSGDQTARIWDGENGTPLSVLSGHTALVANGAFSPDGTRILTASIDGGLRLWDAATAELIAVLRGHVDGIVPELVFAPDGSRLVSGSNDGTVRVWDLKLVERNGILRGHESFVYDVAFSPDGKQIASAAWDGTARLWEATTGRQTGTLKHEKPIVAGVAYSGDGRRLATSERDRGYSIWDVMTGQPVVTLNASAGYFLADTRVALNQHGTRFAAGCAQGPVRIWDLTGKPEAVEFKGHERCSIDVCFHPTRDELASTGEDGTVRIWDISASTCLATLRAHSGSVWRAVYSGDGKLLASGSSDKTVRVWDAQTYKEIRSVSVGSVIYSLAFSPDGRRLAAGCSDNAIRLIDVESGQEVAELRGHSSYVHGVAWSSDGTRIVSASGDFTLRVWDSLSSQDRANMDQ